MITSMLRHPEGADQFAGKVVKEVSTQATISDGVYLLRVDFTDGTWAKARLEDAIAGGRQRQMQVTYENGKDTVP